MGCTVKRFLQFQQNSCTPKWNSFLVISLLLQCMGVVVRRKKPWCREKKSKGTKQIWSLGFFPININTKDGYELVCWIWPLYVLHWLPLLPCNSNTASLTFVLCRVLCPRFFLLDIYLKHPTHRAAPWVSWGSPWGEISTLPGTFWKSRKKGQGEPFPRDCIFLEP